MSINSKDNKYHILNKDNFDIWYFQLESMLAQQKAGYVLECASIEAARDLLRTVPNKWNEHQGLAKSLFSQTLTLDDLRYIMDGGTASEMVGKLRRRYARGITSYQVNQDLSDLKWSRIEKADQFINKLNKIIHQFRSLNLPVDHTRFIQKLIEQIPSFMNDLKQDFQRQLNRNQTLVYESVCEEIILTYDQRTKNQDKALTVTDQNANKSTQKKNDDRKTFYQKKGTGKWCHYHKSKAHSSEECNKLKEKRLNSANNQTNNQMTNASQQSTNSKQLSTSNSTSKDNSANSTKSNSIEVPSIFTSQMARVIETDCEMFFDSCCTRHMTPRIEHFSNFKEIDGPSVMTGNGIVQVKGIGTVCLKSFTDSEWISLDLTEVFYVPTLPAFLFSEPVCGNAGVDTQTNSQQGKLRLVYKGKTLFTGTRDPNTIEPFTMNVQIVKKAEMANVAVVSKLQHFRTGHCPYTGSK